MRIARAIAVLGLIFFAAVGSGQTRPANVLGGVFTEEQAEAGEQVYSAICAACHEGDEPEAAPPKGSEFVERWREAPLSFLYSFLRTKMPGDKPGALSESTYIDVMAYLLRVNGYPIGAAKLTADKIHDIVLVGADGPKPLPANALVSAVGCLAPGIEDTWTLTSATTPLRVRVGDETTAEELAVSRAAALGSASYTLKNAEDFPALKLKGHKVQAKGVLTKAGAPYTLSLQSLESLGDDCGK
jgi:mono/diheme cytochrome c family protein